MTPLCPFSRPQPSLQFSQYVTLPRPRFDRFLFVNGRQWPTPGPPGAAEASPGVVGGEILLRSDGLQTAVAHRLETARGIHC